jgi:flagellar L-ring protein precursor FlgH
MKRFAQIFAALTLAVVPLPGCMLMPFAPIIAHAVPRMLFPNHDPSHQITRTKDGSSAPDPQIEAAVTAPAAVAGDSGVGIDQQDRVTFIPAAPGSIPLRVAAADLVADVKARAVGDVLTVNVIESVAGESKGGASLSNQRAIAAGVPNLFGIAEAFAKKDPTLSLGNLVNGSSNNSTTGAGDLTATDTFTATVSAVVTAVNPSGTLAIKGLRKIRVNGEDDTIHLSGVVRPLDIDDNDSISSAQIANLDLSITGEGQIRDKQGDGLGTRLLDWLWLF